MGGARNIRLKVRFVRPGSPISEEVLVEKLPCRIGRGATNDIDLGDGSVSSRHAVLEYDETSRSLVLRDLGSRNGVRRSGSLDVVKGEALPVEGAGASFILGQLQIDIERLDLPTPGPHPTATVEVKAPAKLRKEGTASGPQVAVTDGMISSRGPAGGLRNIRMREPTGGIRIDRGKRGHSASIRLSRGQAGGKLKFERRARHDVTSSPSRRRKDSGSFWFGILAVLGGSALSSHLLIDSGLAEVIPAAFDKYLSVIIALAVLGVLLTFSMFVVGFRFIFCRDDIDFKALYMQVAGALGMAYGVSLALGAGAGLLEIEGHSVFSTVIASLGRAGFFLFSAQAFLLLRSRSRAAGFFSRGVPWAAALLVLVFSLYRGASSGPNPERGIAMLGEAPQVAPFVTLPSDADPDSRQIPSVDQAVAEFAVAVQELDERRVRKESEKPR